MGDANNKITRRDFMNGVAIGTGAALLGPNSMLVHAAGEPPVYYPPSLTGLRGNHPGSYEVSHAFAWNGEKPANHRSGDEHYDLVIVGAGISGLAAARFYQQQAGDDAKVLILDNHDDFGGHAKRNEFHEQGQMLLGVGGSVNLEEPDSYSDVAKGLLDDLGVDLSAMAENIGEYGLLNSKEGGLLALPAGQEHVAVHGKWMELMLGVGDYKTAVRALPLAQTEQDKLIEFFGGEVNYLEALSLDAQQAYVETVTYAQFLTEKVGLEKDTIELFFPMPRVIYGPAGLRVSVMEAFYLGCPGVQSLPWLSELANQIIAGVSSDTQSTLYFPDGNASVARLLVHRLIPEVASHATGFADIAAARFNYAVLDQADHAVRLRLNSTAVSVKENADDRVVVDYVQNGSPLRVTADRCVLACYNAAIPYLCPELPEPQKEALGYGVKVPLVLSNVVLKDGRAWQKLGVDSVLCPQDPYDVMTTAPPTTTGGHKPLRSADDPMVVFLIGVPKPPTTGKETSHDILRAARHQVYATTFATYEQEIRDQLQGVLGQHGFNHETDIKAITVNRWPHGYAYEYMSLDDPDWEAGYAPHEIGRAQFGRISIANSDSEAYAYLNAAIDSAWRAVQEQTS